MKLFRKVPARLWHIIAMMVLCSVFGPYAFGQRPGCPVVTIAETNFSFCNADGTASVQITVQLDNSFSLDPNDFAIAFMECEPDGTPAGTNSVGVPAGESDVTLSVVCIYPTPSTPQPFVRFTDVNAVPKDDCPPVPVPFAPLAPCAGGCPTIGSIIVDANPQTPDPDPLTCNFAENGSWSIALDASINNKDNVEDGYLWHFGDGQTLSIAANDSGAPRTVHDYQCPDTGDHFVTLTVVGCVGALLSKLAESGTRRC